MHRKHRATIALRAIKENAKHENKHEQRNDPQYRRGKGRAKMKSSTFNILASVLDSDPSVSRNDRELILRIASGKAPENEATPLPTLVSREQLAKLAGKTVKWCDWVAAKHPENLHRVVLPGSKRSSGFTYESVKALLTSANPCTSQSNS